jgi:hypothetical protein
VSLEALPAPPGKPAEIHVTVIELAGPFFRTHGIKRGPLSPGNTGINRFDAPDRSYGVLYLGCDAYCAFVETFAHPSGTRTVTTAALKSRALSQLKPTRPLRLIDLAGSGALVRAGVDSRLFAGEYQSAQLWSKALHDHPAKADGLLYPSRLDPSRRAVALFLDQPVKFAELSRQSWYSPGPQRVLLATIAEHYKIELIENEFVASRKPVRQETMF